MTIQKYKKCDGEKTKIVPSFMKYCTSIINIFHKHVVKWLTKNSIETNKLHVDFFF